MQKPGMTTKPMIPDGLAAGDSSDDMGESSNKFHCPGCGKSYKLVPDAPDAPAEVASGPLSDADMIEQYGKG